MYLEPQISQPKHGQIVHVGGVLKTSGPADFKSAPGFENWQTFVGVIEQSKIYNSLCQYCTTHWHQLEWNTGHAIYENDPLCPSINILTIYASANNFCRPLLFWHSQLLNIFCLFDNPVSRMFTSDVSFFHRSSYQH